MQVFAIGLPGGRRLVFTRGPKARLTPPEGAAGRGLGQSRSGGREDRLWLASSQGNVAGFVPVVPLAYGGQGPKAPPAHTMGAAGWGLGRSRPGGREGPAGLVTQVMKAGLLVYAMGLRPSCVECYLSALDPGEAPQRMVGARRLPCGARRSLLDFRSRIVIAPELWRLDLLCAFWPSALLIHK